MEELCSLLDMRWRPSIFVWEVSCKSSRAFSLRVTDLGSGDFIFSTTFDLRLPSFLLANICILCLQLHSLFSSQSRVRFSNQKESRVHRREVRKREASEIIVVFSNSRTSFHQYQVVWRKLPTGFYELPKIYGMKLWA